MNGLKIGLLIGAVVLTVLGFMSLVPGAKISCSVWLALLAVEVVGLIVYGLKVKQSKND